MAISVFYLPILPLGVVIAFCGLFIMYWVEKYNILYHYKRPEKIDGQITRAYIGYFRIFIFIYAISIYIFLGDIFPNQTDFSLVGIVLFGVLVILPYGSFLKKVGFFQVSAFTNDKYEDLYFEMGMNYEMANPLTKQKGFERYLDRLKEKNIINDEEYFDHMKRIKSAPSDILELYYKKKYGKQKGKRINLFKGLLKNMVYDQGENQKNHKDYLKMFGNKNNFFGMNLGGNAEGGEQGEDKKPKKKLNFKGLLKKKNKAKEEDSKQQIKQAQEENNNYGVTSNNVSPSNVNNNQENNNKIDYGQLYSNNQNLGQGVINNQIPNQNQPIWVNNNIGQQGGQNQGQGQGGQINYNQLYSNNNANAENKKPYYD